MKKRLDVAFTTTHFEMIPSLNVDFRMALSKKFEDLKEIKVPTSNPRIVKVKTANDVFIYKIDSISTEADPNSITTYLVGSAYTTFRCHVIMTLDEEHTEYERIMEQENDERTKNTLWV